MIFDIDTIPMC